MKKIIKNIAAQLHLWLGIPSGLVVFIVALTGSILVFEDELEPVINKTFHIVSSFENKHPLSLDSLTSIVAARFPQNRLSRIIIDPDEDRTIVMGLKQPKKEDGLLSAAINPYNGQIVGVRQQHNTFFEVVLRLHRYLCMGDTGKTITGISCVCFLIIMLTGLVLWWPGRKNRRQRFRVKWNASAKRLNWDVHAVFGFYALPFVFLIAATGLVWSYKWVNNLIYLTFDGKPFEKREVPANITPASKSITHYQQIWDETNRQLPHRGKVIFNGLETDSLSTSVSKSDDEAAISNLVSFLYFDKNTGSLISKRLYENESKGFKARRTVYPIHTGSLLGWPTKIIAFIAALIAASLPVTGFIIWLGKRTKSRKKADKLLEQSTPKLKRSRVEPGMLVKRME